MFLPDGAKHPPASTSARIGCRSRVQDNRHDMLQLVEPLELHVFVVINIVSRVLQQLPATTSRACIIDEVYS